MASQGYDLFRQQSNILILGLVGCLWLFRRKELGWYNRGEKFRKSQRYEEAIAAYDKAIKIKPGYSEAWYAKAALLYKLQRYEEALIAYEKVIQIQPEEAHAWFVRGWILGELQRYAQAITSYDKALEIDGNLDEAWFYRGKTLEKWKRYEDAIASYDQAIQLQPNHADAWYNKACCYTLLGNVSIAIETLQKAMGFNPERFREEAKTNSCFDAIRENQIFKQLVGM
jgi:tetratricopeptide (TPR) repeat protein